MENVADLRIDLNTKDNCGSTAFHDACGLSHANVVKIIMENAAALSIDLHMKNNCGMSGFDIASNAGWTDVAKIFCLMEKTSPLRSIDLNKNGENGFIL